MVKHPVILRGYRAAPLDDDAPPVILRRTEDDFVTALLADLRQNKERGSLGEPTSADRPSGRLRLRQPVHRTFNLVLLEAACEQPGRPRLNPRSIESAGLVVRRVRDETDPSRDEAWQFREATILGWQGFTGEQWRLDPDPARRPGRAPSAPAQVQSQLLRIRGLTEPPQEVVAPLFLAPPDVCNAAGRTLVYGVIPATSADERTRREPESVDDEVVSTLLPPFLRNQAGNYAQDLGRTTVSVSEIRANEQSETPDSRLELFILGLRALHGVWHVFDAAVAGDFLDALNEIEVTFAGGSTLALGDFLSVAKDALLVSGRDTDRVTLPVQWPYPDEPLAKRLAAKAKAALESHFAAQAPRIKRFDEKGAVYRAHAFIRVRHGACPAETFWATPSEVFEIVPWWEGGGPVHTIAMPDLDQNALRALKPNVAFMLPAKLANLINQSDPESLMKGKGKAGDNPQLGWICSFSIPIITLCAFIVLNIFLSLFNLIFQWLFFIKICLPFPKKLSPPSP